MEPAAERAARRCPSCGTQHPPTARFCSACGNALSQSTAPTDVRKVVTTFFSDVSGSTVLGESLDPETMRHVMGRYFAAAAAVLERHGGTVEKFVGDAVMAVFGIPRVREDDALRAARAAVELRDALVGLNEELGAQWGVHIQTRTGIN